MKRVEYKKLNACIFSCISKSFKPLLMSLRSIRNKNNNKQNDYFLRTLTTAREHLKGKTRPKVKAITSSQELTYSHGKPSKGQQSTERTALIFIATAKHLNAYQ